MSVSLYEFSKLGRVQVTPVSSSGIAAWVSVDICSEQPSLAAPVAGKFTKLSYQNQEKRKFSENIQRNSRIPEGVIATCS